MLSGLERGSDVNSHILMKQLDSQHSHRSDNAMKAQIWE